jgi:alkanesulfonate monooxygenase SsuD/methylene tetrahydromethanopterin reductase-like flavin-dependent oxidoreductase (luciferase family)
VRLATLDILSGGRVELGVGRSGYPYQMVPFGTDLADATGIVEETLEIFPRAWTEDTVSYHGRYFRIPPRQVIPKPVQRPHPPLWQACTQEETFRKAGQQGLGCITQASVGPQRTEGLIQIYRDAIRAAVPIAKFVNNQVTGSTVAYCAEDRRKAFERGAELIDWYRHQQRLRDAIVWQDYEISKLPDTYRWHYQRMLADAARQDDTSSLSPTFRPKPKLASADRSGGIRPSLDSTAQAATKPCNTTALGQLQGLMFCPFQGYFSV